MSDGQNGNQANVLVEQPPVPAGPTPDVGGMADRWNRAAAEAPKQRPVEAAEPGRYDLTFPTPWAPKGLDEVGRRKPGFREGTPVVLDDGQEWHLPWPLVRFGMDNGPRGFRPMAALIGDDGSFQRAYDRMQKFHDFMNDVKENNLSEQEQSRRFKEDPGLNWIGALFQAGKALLQANYELSDAEVAGLLTFDPNEDLLEDEPGRMALVSKVAEGVAPKPRGGGSGSLS